MCPKMNWFVDYKFIVWFKLLFFFLSGALLLALAKSIYSARAKVTCPATPKIMQNLVFSDYTMKMTVEASLYFPIVLSLKANESN